ncbi:radical SAM protein [bacterium]|nr:radical SAM protein [bacterium]MBU1985032.1 radical SAM protein [bacterium]
MILTGLHLLLTYRCLYECDHCFVYSSPKAEATMPLAMALDAVRQARELGTVNEIYLEGGEPFLHYPIMVEVIREASRLGLEIGIVTNGYFAVTVEDAEVWLKPLLEAGLSSVSVSDDTFHSDESEEITPAARTAEAARNLGINVGTICIEPPRGICDGKEKGAPVLGGDVRFRGRAVEKLADENLPRKSWDSFDECPDEDFEKIGRLHLDPFGYLYSCQGVVAGNLKEKSLAEIVREYQPATEPIIGPLMRGGPAALVREYRLPLEGQYIDACHLCYLARKMLRERYPDHLAPPQVYGDA